MWINDNGRLYNADRMLQIRHEQQRLLNGKPTDGYSIVFDYGCGDDFYSVKGYTEERAEAIISKIYAIASYVSDEPHYHNYGMPEE